MGHPSDFGGSVTIDLLTQIVLTQTPRQLLGRFEIRYAVPLSPSSLNHNDLQVGLASDVPDILTSIAVEGSAIFISVDGARKQAPPHTWTLAV